MNCREVRKQLAASSAPVTVVEAEHIASCSHCARYALQLGALRQGLREHHAHVEPDRGFADRVVSRLERQEPAVALGRAALQLLPATLALLAVLGWLSVRDLSPVIEAEDAAPTSDAVAWLLEAPEVVP